MITIVAQADQETGDDSIIDTMTTEAVALGAGDATETLGEKYWSISMYRIY